MRDILLYRPHCTECGNYCRAAQLEFQAHARATQQAVLYFMQQIFLLVAWSSFLSRYNDTKTGMYHMHTHVTILIRYDVSRYNALKTDMR